MRRLPIRWPLRIRRKTCTGTDENLLLLETAIDLQNLYSIETRAFDLWSQYLLELMSKKFGRFRLIAPK